MSARAAVEWSALRVYALGALAVVVPRATRAIGPADIALAIPRVGDFGVAKAFVEYSFAVRSLDARVARIAKRFAHGLAFVAL